MVWCAVLLLQRSGDRVEGSRREKRQLDASGSSVSSLLPAFSLLPLSLWSVSATSLLDGGRSSGSGSGNGYYTAGTAGQESKVHALLSPGYHLPNPFPTVPMDPFKEADSEADLLFPPLMSLPALEADSETGGSFYEPLFGSQIPTSVLTNGSRRPPLRQRIPVSTTQISYERVNLPPLTPSLSSQSPVSLPLPPSKGHRRPWAPLVRQQSSSSGSSRQESRFTRQQLQPLVMYDPVTPGAEDCSQWPAVRPVFVPTVKTLVASRAPFRKLTLASTRAPTRAPTHASTTRHPSTPLATPVATRFSPATYGDRRKTGGKVTPPQVVKYTLLRPPYASVSPDQSLSLSTYDLRPQIDSTTPTTTTTTSTAATTTTTTTTTTEAPVDVSSQSVVDYVDSESSPEEEEQTLEQETQTEDGGATREEEKKERKQINLFHRRPDYRHLYSKYSRGWTSTTAAVTEAPEATTSARSEEGAAFGSRLPATRASSRTSTATSVSFSSSSSSSSSNSNSNSNSNNIRSNKTRTTSHYPYSGRKERTRTTTATPVPQAPTTGPALFVGKLASMQPLLQDPSEEEAIEVPVASSRQDFKKVFSSNAAGVHVTRHGTHAGQRHALLPLLPPNAAPTSSPQ